SWLATSDSQCRYNGETGFLSSVAAAGMSPDVEDAAIAALAGPDWALAADAAKMLAAQGSARAEAPLWAALDAWHGRWVGQRARLFGELGKDESSWDAVVDGPLRGALSNAMAWRLDERDYARMLAICLTPRCEDDVERLTKD